VLSEHKSCPPPPPPAWVTACVWVFPEPRNPPRFGSGLLKLCPEQRGSGEGQALLWSSSPDSRGGLMRAQKMRFAPLATGAAPAPHPHPLPPAQPPRPHPALRADPRLSAPRSPTAKPGPTCGTGHRVLPAQRPFLIACRRHRYPGLTAAVCY